MGAADLRALTSEYRHILDHLGRLYEESLVGPVGAALTMELRTLDAALAAHFALEHDVMQATHYPHTGEHEKIHGLIRRVVDKLVIAAEHSDDGLFQRELPFLLHLVLDHRTGEDRSLDEFVDGLEMAAAAVH